MVSQLDLLIKILFDKTAREDERHDAAIDIGAFNDDYALGILLQIASNPYEDEIILDACGESIAKILLNRKEFRKDLIDRLTPIAKDTAYVFVKERRPDLI